jgi:dephospho-CoA kinase
LITVGIYGRIGSGKSEVARVFRECGAVVLDADVIAREVVEQDQAVLKSLVAAFGDDIVDSDGNLKRRELGKIVFSSEKNREKLNEIVHPPVLKRIRDGIDLHRKSGDCTMLVVDAPLIIGSGLEDELDVLVCVTAPEDSQIQRAACSGLSEQDVRDRLKSQLPVDVLIEKADYTIHNDSTLEELGTQARRLFRQINDREK